MNLISIKLTNVLIESDKTFVSRSYSKRNTRNKITYALIEQDVPVFIYASEFNALTGEGNMSPEVHCEPLKACISGLKSEINWKMSIEDPAYLRKHEFPHLWYRTNDVLADKLLRKLL